MKTYILYRQSLNCSCCTLEFCNENKINEIPDKFVHEDDIIPFEQPENSSSKDIINVKYLFIALIFLYLNF